jgi:hypothetical protein
MAQWVEQLPRPAPVEILPGHEVGCAIPPGRPSPNVNDEQLRLAERIFSDHHASVTVRW